MRILAGTYVLQRLVQAFDSEEERNVIHTVKEMIGSAVGVAPKGWLSPGHAETFDTPDHLAAEGFEYVCDWSCDDQPIPMRVRSGRMIAMPYRQGMNDMTIFVNSRHTPEQFLRMAYDQFDTLYAEGARSGRVIGEV